MWDVRHVMVLVTLAVQCSGWSGRGHLSTCAGWCSPSVSSLQSLVSAAVKTYSTISSWIQVHWAAELQFAVPAVKVWTKFRDKFHNWQYLEKVPTRAFSLKISIKWVHLTLRNLSSKIFAKWVLVSGLICEDLKTACQVNYRLTHCDKCQFIKCFNM